MEAGSFAITNDEVLLFRVGWGIHRRVQLNFMLGGFGVPFGGTIAAAAGIASINVQLNVFNVTVASAAAVGGPRRAVQVTS